MLTLGCVCLLAFSIPPVDGWPAAAYLCLEFKELLSSSPKSAESIMLLLMGDWFGCCGRTFRTGNDCSFEGGAGGISGSDVLEFSPSGPSGPRESSTASKRVACTPTFRAVRGFRPAGDLGVADGERGEACAGFGFVSVSTNLSANRQIGAKIPIETLFVGFSSFGKVCMRA